MEGLDLFSNTTTGFNPFDTGAPKPTEEVKQAAIDEAKELASAARTIEVATQRARKRGNNKALEKLGQMATELGKLLWEFVKKAFLLSVFKFVMEICAMVVQSLVQSMVNRGHKPVDISTPGVMYTVPGAQPVTAPPPQNQHTNRYNSNPFGDVFGTPGGW